MVICARDMSAAQGKALAASSSAKRILISKLTPLLSRFSVLMWLGYN